MSRNPGGLFDDVFGEPSGPPPPLTPMELAYQTLRDLPVGSVVKLGRTSFEITNNMGVTVAKKAGTSGRKYYVLAVEDREGNVYARQGLGGTTDTDKGIPPVAVGTLVIRNPPQRKPITIKLVRDNTDSMRDLVLFAYAGKRKVGHIQIFKVRRLADLDARCQEELDRIRGDRPGISAYVVWKSHVSERYRQRGVGSMLYEAALAHLKATHLGATALVPMQCLSYGTTSPAAKRVWDSLARRRDHASRQAVLANPPRARAAARKVRRAVGKSQECYPAAEVVYHAGGGRRSGLTPVQQRHEGRSHWWVRGPAGEVLDPAASQFNSPVPYERGRGRGFLTSRPSRRARQLAGRAGVRLNPPFGADWLTPQLEARLQDAERCAVKKRTRLYGPREGLLVCEDVPFATLDLIRDHSGLDADLERGIVLYPGFQPTTGWPDVDQRKLGRPYGHWWIRLEDGTIVDTAASQFGERSPLVIPFGHPAQARYVPEDPSLPELEPGMWPLALPNPLGCKLVSLSEDSDFEDIEAVTDRDPYTIMNDAERLFVLSGIHLFGHENLYEACIDPDGKVLGVSAVGSTGAIDEGDPEQRPLLSFSVAVSEEARRRGIANALVESLVAAYPRDEVLLEGKVVNPHMVTLLTRHGFRYDQQRDEEWSDLDRRLGRRMYRPNPDWV